MLGLAPKWSIVIRVLQILLALEIVSFAFTTIPTVRHSTSFNPVFDGWLQAGGYITLAILALLRPVKIKAERMVWIWISAGVIARSLAFVIYLAIIKNLKPIPYPSISDAGWLAMYLFLIIGMVTLAKNRFIKLSTSLVLDALTVLFSLLSIATAIIFPVLEKLSAIKVPVSAIATNLAYPVLDITLLVVIVGTILAFDWKPPLYLWIMAACTVAFAVVDTIFLYQNATGTYHPGTILSSLSLLATALIPLSAWRWNRSTISATRITIPGLTIPTLFALFSLGLLVYATQVRVHIISVMLAGGGALIAIIRTVISFKTIRLSAQHRKEARTDDLTSVANRRAFNEMLAEALYSPTQSKNFAVLIIDINDFKSINDTLGHHYGDELLIAVANRLSHVMRTGDLIARLGGDEFGAIINDADSESAEVIAERLQASLRTPFTIVLSELEITASIGIAISPSNGIDPVELLQHADLAMYEAKSRRIGICAYQPEHHQAQKVRLESEKRLRQAIECGEMEIYFQPQINIIHNRVCGAEALVRWNHPKLGLLTPGEFLPQVENAGLMPLLTLTVMRKAIHQTRLWLDQGRDLRIAINMSVINLLDPGFPEAVLEALEQQGVPNFSLDLELTEDLFMADPTRAHRAISELASHGIGVMIDDYGTGYSTLGYLQDLKELRGLKIDRSFVAKMDTDGRASAIVDSTIHLCNSLNLVVIAEGVENREIHQQLVEMGCEIGQGYYYSRPTTADKFEFDMAKI